MECSALIRIHSNIAENAPRPSMSALRPPTPSRSEPDRLRMTLGEQKPCKINENRGSELQLACCGPGLTTPGRPFRKVRGSLGGASQQSYIYQQISMKIHRISTKYDRSRSGPAERAPRRATTAQFYKENHSGQNVAVLFAQTGFL
jgi:hypothetical protein